MRRALPLLPLLALAGCFSPVEDNRCDTAEDCFLEETCVAGRCFSKGESDAASAEHPRVSVTRVGVDGADGRGSTSHAGGDCHCRDRSCTFTAAPEQDHVFCAALPDHAACAVRVPAAELREGLEVRLELTPCADCSTEAEPCDCAGLPDCEPAQ